MKRSENGGAATELGRLSAFIPFLIYRVMAKAASLASIDYDRWGINVQEARTLMLIDDRPGIRAGELSDAACIEASALSHILRHLVTKQLVRRERDSEERRSVRVFLTADGAVLAGRCRDLSNSHERFLLAGLSGKSVETLRESLLIMLDNVDAQAPGTSPWPAIARPSRTTQSPPRKGKPRSVRRSKPSSSEAMSGLPQDNEP